MAIRFLTPWNGYPEGAVATLDTEEDEIEATLIAAGLARDAAETDNAVITPTTLATLVSAAELVDADYADDAAAEAGGIAIGQMYHTEGAVRIRVE